MKRTIVISLALLLSTGFFSIKAQDESDETRWGDNPDNCKMNLSLYVEFFRQKNLDDAYAPWAIVFKECPKSSKNLYIHGVNIVLNKYNKVSEAEEKKKYVDTLFLVYDQRIENFGEEGRVLGMKAIQWNRFFPKDFETTYSISEKSVNLEGNASDPAVVNLYMQMAVEMYEAKKISDEDVFNIYSKCSEIMADLIKQNPDDEKLSVAQNNLDVSLIKTGVATCEKIVEIFTTKYENNKNDLSLVRGIVRLLDSQGCNESKLYSQASEKQYELDPTASSAYALARYFFRSNSFAKAAEYYRKAIELQEDNNEKAKYYYELAVLTGNRLNQPALARTYALKAIEYRNNWGDPYIFIGNLYASSSKDCGQDGFEQATVFWAAVDKYIRARAVDPSCADEANRLINTYSQYFPKREDGFFRTITEGQDYQVGCWINENTKVRLQ